MRRVIVLLLFFSVLLPVGRAQALFIDVLDLKGVIDPQGDVLVRYETIFGGYNPINVQTVGVPPGESHFNAKMGPRANVLTDFFQRTFIPLPPIGQDEWTYMYETNQLYGAIRFGGIKDYVGYHRFGYLPIPDLSAYRIDALYLDNSFSPNGSLIDYDIRLVADAHLMADAAPVPEPSTVFLLGAGIPWLWRRSRKGTPAVLQRSA